MDTGLAGRTVVVTGGNANIGRGISLAFAAERANVVIVGRDERQGLRVVEEARQCGAADSLWHKTDVLDRKQVDVLLQTVIERFGRIDVLVNNVGGNVDFADFVDSDPGTWEQEIALNIVSTLNCTHAALPFMLKQASGRIINIGSTAGLVGDPKLAVYSAMKGAVHAFTKVLAKEVGAHSVTVNAIAPYATFPDDPERETSSGSRYHPTAGLITRAIATRMDELATIARRTVLERSSVKPSEIGAAAVYLASDAAAFITGQVLAIEGGTLIA
jgi:2-hydroxycyclohexanecarboxyl-CoA dehydrogenase